MLKEAPRWWLGEPASQAHVLANLDQMLISDAHEGSGRPGEARPAVDGATLDDQSRKALFDQIQLRGRTMVAEQKVGFATTPSWNGSALQPKPFAVRIFASRKTQSFAVMPGGLSMSVGDTQAIGLHSPRGLTRDVWIQSETKVAPLDSIWASLEASTAYSRAAGRFQAGLPTICSGWVAMSSGQNGSSASADRLWRVLKKTVGPEEDQRTVRFSTQPI